jgi:hypothetical protein
LAGILTQEQKQLAFRLRGRGWRLVDIAKEIGCSAPMVGLMVRGGRFRTGVPDEWEPRPGCLGISDREEILVGVRAGESLREIASRIGRSPSTVSREVAANGGRHRDSAWHAHQRARRQARRPKAFKLRAGPLLNEVTRRLEKLWSPQGDRATLGVGLPRRPGDAGEPRDDLPVPVRSGPRGTTP